MNHAGDAAEQVVRMSLEGAEVALKITGVAAKNLAAALYTILKDQKKTKGKARIEAMLREKRPLKVYTLKKEDCPEFARQAKGYGILYAPIPVRKGDDTIDILVFEDDAARANRIVDKFNLTVVDTASIKEDMACMQRKALPASMRPTAFLPGLKTRPVKLSTNLTSRAAKGLRPPKRTFPRSKKKSRSTRPQPNSLKNKRRSRRQDRPDRPQTVFRSR